MRSLLLNEFSAEKDRLILRIAKVVWAVIGTFAIAYGAIGARFSALVLAFSFLVLMPVIYRALLNRRGALARSTLPFICNFCIYFTSFGLNHQVHSEYFNLAALMVPLIIFDLEESLAIAAGMGLCLIAWAAIQWGPAPVISPEWTASSDYFPILSTLNFVGAFSIIVIFLVIFIRSLARHRDFGIDSATQARDEMERALRISQDGEERLNKAQEIMRVGSWSYDIRSGKITWSRMMFQLFPEDPAKGEPSFERHESTIHADDRKVWKATIESCMETGQPYAMRFRSVFPDKFLWIEAKGSALQSNGKTMGLTGTCQDVTAAVVSSALLKKKEVELKMTFESMQEGLVIQDANGKIVHFNPAAEDILNLSAGALAGKNSMDSSWMAIREDGSPFPGEQHPPMVCLRTKQTVRGVVMGLKQLDGSVRWIRINSCILKDDKGGEVGEKNASRVLSTFSDITDERKGAESVRNLSDRLSVAVRAVGFGVWDWNLKTGVLIWDPYMYELFGIKKEHFNGDYDAFEKTLLPEDAVTLKASLASAFASRSKDFKSEFRILSADGKTRTIAAHAICFYDESGAIERAVGCNWDITTQREVEAKLISSEKMSSLGEMAGGVAHEINNPLTIIKGKAIHLIRKAEAGQLEVAKVIDDLKKIDATADRIARIIKGLRTFSRNSDKDPMQPGSLKEILNDTLELCNKRFKNNSVDLIVSVTEDAVIDCRSTQLSQVLMNLLGNSFDAVQALPEKWVELKSEFQGDKIIIRIMDSGKGIPPEVVNKMMQPFFSTKEIGKGTGLGLSISQGIIDEHQGRLYYDSSSPNTCFVVELPAKMASSNNKSHAA